MLTISYGSSGPSFDVANSAADGFELACAPDGSFYLHLNYLLSNSAGGFGSTGVYLLELEMYALGEDIDSCQPFWIVFNNEASEEDHEAAIEWVEENLALEEHLAQLLLLDVLAQALVFELRHVVQGGCHLLHASDLT